MLAFHHRTKIVATIGPASASPDVIERMVRAGMNVARLNFSHGSQAEHQRMITILRAVSRSLDRPVTLLQDLQGPKIRIGQLENDELALSAGDSLTLLPLDAFRGEPATVPLDYAHLAAAATPGTLILLDDGLLELSVTAIDGPAVCCEVIRDGLLKSRKGVNLPTLNLQLPSLTAKDRQDLHFGIEQGIDWVSLSFVRQPEDLQVLKSILAEYETKIPVIAKIEKPQALEHLDGILDSCDGVMVARGDLGVEVNPERVPMIQKRIIRRCNQRGLPVITATQMLESMIQNPRPTRAEASDVANAIVDGTDAVMLSGESAVGRYPVEAIAMMAKIAREVEKEATFVNFPPISNDETNALSEALGTIDKLLELHCIVAFTSSGYTARLAAAERPRAPVVAITTNEAVYHQLNLIWGVRPLLVEAEVQTFEDMLDQAETYLLSRQLAERGDRILILGGIPTQRSGGTNFLKLHCIGER
ncbi:MAG: pyruvate kinase [Leptolyngbya sp. SIO4C1]|nr:pyruvate kinase [Leptolyngbya sp. SIO4C1]